MESTPARHFFDRFEPVHGITYFAPGMSVGHGRRQLPWLLDGLLRHPAVAALRRYGVAARLTWRHLPPRPNSPHGRRQRAFGLDAARRTGPEPGPPRGSRGARRALRCCGTAPAATAPRPTTGC